MSPPGVRSCAGGALFYAYLAQAKQNEDHAATAMTLLAHMIEGVATQTLPHSLYTGLASIAWTLTHLQGHLFEPDPDTVEPLIDQTLLAALTQSPWRHDYDLMSVTQVGNRPAHPQRSD